ncbi:DNA topoisomerase IB [Microbaculum marinum]|uniref:DNA topoisomerase IB n=1 Tax=Microbaculum marinum TaxID=1764581 RepID=A0AAW9RST8_9HYPH
MKQDNFRADARQLRAAGLVRVGSADLPIRRQRRGRGFVYLDENDRRISDDDVLDRIRSLAIPPAYRDVRIAADERAHLQAVGVDDAGRTQYRYHPDWSDVREGAKERRLNAIVSSIGRIRSRIARDARKPVGTREKALAAVVMLIDRSHIRVGCETYVHSGRSRGAATLQKRNVLVDGDNVALAFRAKGGLPYSCSMRAPLLARVLSELSELPGGRVFQYRDQSGRRIAVTAPQVNAYLHEIAGTRITAKDFRALAACAEAGRRLAAIEPADRPTKRRRQIAAVIDDVAEILGNTPAVVRKNYVHALVLEAFEDGSLGKTYRKARAGQGRRRDEALVAALVAAKGR